MTLNDKWWKGTSTLFALDKEQRCKFMILLRGPFERREIAEALMIKHSTVYGWETKGKTPRLDHLRAMLRHFAAWYVNDALPGTLEKALAEITPKKDLTTDPRPDKKDKSYPRTET